MSPEPESRRPPLFQHWRHIRQALQETMASSPESASTMNSWDEDPPMEPVSASTARKLRPQRSKMRVRPDTSSRRRGRRGSVHVEGVGILHDELAAAHQAEAGADLVAELALDLVEIERHLPVALDLAPHQVGHHLFVGRSHAEFGLLSVLEAQQLLAVLLPAPRLLPELGRLHRSA